MAWGAVIIAIFLATGGSFFLNSIVVGTTAYETAIKTVAPILFAGICFGVLFGVFKK